MASNNLVKKTFVLIFLLAVLIAIFIWQGNGFSQDYLGWLGTGLARLNPFDIMIGPELELAEDSGLDLSNVNIEEMIIEQSESIEESTEESIEEKVEETSAEEPLVSKDEIPKEEVIIGIGGPVESVIVVSENKMTLEDIEQEINRITKEVERIDENVQSLVALYE